MGLLNASLLTFGGLFIAVPIALHLLMRQRPKHMVFPALRFVKPRKEANRRRLQLRQWLLLALRCAAICVLAGALARPTVDSTRMANWFLMAGVALVLLFVTILLVATIANRKGVVWVSGLIAGEVALLALMFGLVTSALRDTDVILFGDQRAPVAAALVFDTSPRLQYLSQGRTRLEEARDNAQWLLKQLPDGSDIAVLDSHSTHYAFAVDRGAALRAIKGLDTANVPRPLLDVLRQACTLAEESSHRRKEIYVFTDLNELAWSTEYMTSDKPLIPGKGRLSIYIWDVGVDQPRNSLLAPLQLSETALAQTTELSVQTELLHTGDGDERTVELYVETSTGQLPVIMDGKPILPEATLRRRQSITVGNNSRAVVNFSTGDLDFGIYHGFVQLVGRDGLQFDDRRYFTVDVEAPWKILVVSGRGAEPKFIVDALSPMGLPAGRFSVDQLPVDSLEGADIDRYQAVCLLDPPPLSDSVWSKLESYVTQGNGLALYLGQNVARFKEELNRPAAQKILPGPLDTIWRSPGGDWFLSPSAFEHPILGPFFSERTTIPWDLGRVFRHWGIGQLAPESTVICRFSNGQPAILERSIGGGRVLTMTTPVSDPKNRTDDRQSWNHLLTSLESWPTFVLCNEMMRYLAQQRDSRLNYFAGETASLRLPPGQQERWQLFTPRLDWRGITADDGQLVYPFTDYPGAYRVSSITGPEPSTARGFSVNLPLQASNLDRMDPRRLDEILGKGRYQVASSRENINRGVEEGRIGREFYPYLLLLLVVVLALEQVLANTFYASTNEKETSSFKSWIRPSRPPTPAVGSSSNDKSLGTVT